MSLTKATYAMIDGAPVNILDFGAVGDGITDDTAAIQAAIDSTPNGLVFFPVGTYKISDSIQIKGSILGTGVATVIQPATDTFPAFVNNQTAIAKFSIKGLFINYAVATGGDIPSTNPASAGFYFTNNGANTLYPYEFILQDIWIRCAYTGYKDSSYSYMFTLRNVRIDFAVNGFYKDVPGTTVLLENCYTTNTSRYAYYFNEVNGLTIESSAFDRGDNTVSGVNLFYCTNCSGVNINSFDFEINTIAAPFTAAFAFDFCLGVCISGLRGYQNTFATGASDVYGILFTRQSFGVIEGVTIGASEDITTGTGDMSVVVVQQGSSVNIDACRLTAPLGTTGGRFSLKMSGASTTVVSATNNTLNAVALSTDSKLINNQIPSISANIGDNNVNVAIGVTPATQLFNSPLSTVRSVNISALGVYQGAQLTVVRTAAATGASGLQIVDSGTSTVIRTLAVGQYATVTYSSGWFVTSAGSL